MANILGYIGFSLNLASMAMRDFLFLRILSLLANAIYIVYGLLIEAMPFVIGCSVAVIIHAVNIYKLKKQKYNDNRYSKQ